MAERPQRERMLVELKDGELAALVREAVRLELASHRPPRPRAGLAEAAAHLGVCERTVREWIKHKALPAKRAGRDWRFDLEELDQWVDAQPTKPRAKLRRVK